MKRKLMIIGITILLILTSAVTSYADLSLIVGLIADTTEAKVGDTFTVTLTASCSDGINGVVTTYSYDEDKLEYVSEGVVDTDNYSFGGNKDAKEIFVYCTSTDSIQSANLYYLTFRVKEGVAAGSTAKVSIGETTLDSDAATDSEHTMDGSEVTVTIVEPPCEHTYGNDTFNNDGTHTATCSKCGEERTENCTYQDGKCADCGYAEPTTGGGNETCEHSFENYKDNNDGTHTGTCSKCGEKQTEEHTYENLVCTDCKSEHSAKNCKHDNGSVSVVDNKDGTHGNVCEVCGEKFNTEKHTYKNGTCTKCNAKQPKDNTTANKEIPKAGLSTMLTLGIVAIVVIAVVMYRKNQKYRDIR